MTVAAVVMVKVSVLLLLLLLLLPAAVVASVTPGSYVATSASSSMLLWQQCRIAESKDESLDRSLVSLLTVVQDLRLQDNKAILGCGLGCLRLRRVLG